MKNVFRLLTITIIIVVATLLIMVINDIIFPQQVEVVITPDMIVLPETGSGGAPLYAQPILGDDSDDWAESAHALGISSDSMTIHQFFDHNSR